MDFNSNSNNSLDTKRRRRSTWTNDDEIQLLKIWEAYESEFQKYKRKTHIYEKISKEMGGKFSAKKVHHKIKNLTQRYRAEVREVGPTGESPTKWENFHYVHKIIGGKKTGVESFAFFASNSNSFSASTTLATADFVPKTSPPSYSKSSPLSSLASSISRASTIPPDPLNALPTKREDINYDRELLENIKNLTKQGEEQLYILRNIAEDSRNFSQNVCNYLQQQQENEKKFMECFKALVDKF